MTKNIAILVLTIFYIFLTNIVFAHGLCCQKILEKLDTKFPENTSQLIIVTCDLSFKANLIACEKNHDIWKEVFKNKIKANIGRNGFVVSSQKREGDGKTPLGLYSIGNAFGTKEFKTRMNFRYITKEDKLIDDIDNPDYNRWVTGETAAKSYEAMLRPEYKLGFVINYNMHPIVSGAGSAIFAHIWEAEYKATRGCIAMNEDNMVKLISWLDKNKHPMIYIR